MNEGGGEGGGVYASYLEPMVDDVDNISSHGQTQVVETQLPGTDKWTSMVVDVMVTGVVDGGGGPPSSHAFLPPATPMSTYFRHLPGVPKGAHCYSAT